MKIVVGLGNPGLTYAATRHNIGFALVDRLSDDLGISITKNQHQALVATANYQGNRVLLVKPQTYMNRSGVAVAALARFYRVPLADILVVYDDLDLPVGKIRLRAKGGPGTHNGMRSLIEHLSSEDFPRLRIGIDRPDEADWAKYVLSQFTKAELPVVREALELGCKAVETFITEGIDQAMNEFNSK